MPVTAVYVRAAKSGSHRECREQAWAEGFGLPVLEAALHRLPVFGSDIKAHREVAHGAAEFFKLEEKPAAIAERIQRLSEEALKVGEGSLYPALYRLQDRGWIESEWGQSENNRRAKYYKLTNAGRKQLEIESEGWERLCVAIRQVMQSA